LQRLSDRPRRRLRIEVTHNVTLRPGNRYGLATTAPAQGGLAQGGQGRAVDEKYRGGGIQIEASGGMCSVVSHERPSPEGPVPLKGTIYDQRHMNPGPDPCLSMVTIRHSSHLSYLVTVIPRNRTSAERFCADGNRITVLSCPADWDSVPLDREVTRVHFKG
jgi:hypothetical protein